MQPRFTARLVEPTPPVAPATAMTVLPRDRSPCPKRCAPIRSRADTRSSIRTGCGRNSFTPLRIARRIRFPSVDELITTMLHSGDNSCS